jgi:hypothetical protein
LISELKTKNEKILQLEKNYEEIFSKNLLIENKLNLLTENLNFYENINMRIRKKEEDFEDLYKEFIYISNLLDESQKKNQDDDNTQSTLEIGQKIIEKIVNLNEKN